MHITKNTKEYAFERFFFDTANYNRKEYIFHNEIFQEFGSFFAQICVRKYYNNICSLNLFSSFHIKNKKEKV